MKYSAIDSKGVSCESMYNVSVLSKTQDYVDLYRTAANVISNVCKKYGAKALVVNDPQDVNLTVYWENDDISTESIYSDILKTLNDYFITKNIEFFSDDVGTMYIHGKDVEGISFKAKNKSNSTNKNNLTIQQVLNLPEIKRLLAFNNKEVYVTKLTNKITVKYLFFKSDFEESFKEDNKKFNIGQLHYECANSDDIGAFDDFDVFYPAFKSLIGKIQNKSIKLKLDDYSDDETVHIIASF